MNRDFRDFRIYFYLSWFNIIPFAQTPSTKTNTVLRVHGISILKQTFFLEINDPTFQAFMFTKPYTVKAMGMVHSVSCSIKRLNYPTTLAI